MKSLSIKYFTLFAVLFLLLGVTISFINFYATSKANISELLKDNIQNNSLDIKHFLDKNLEIDNINNLVSHLDSITSSSNIINDIHILDDKQNIIYSSDREFEKYKSSCITISQISQENVLNEECYSFHITLHKGLTPYYYSSRIFINHTYLDKLLYDNTIRILNYFSILLVLFFLFLWLILKRTIILPLEKLRQYAYYSEKEPKEFFISEIESIRYSLSMTFSRLKKEQKELYNLSTKDQLSGLYNRMSLMEKITWLISNNERKNEKFAMIFLDLDNFKTINDSMGHDFGDKILQKVSQTLLKSVRDNDIVSRIGGDEFVVVLPQNIEDETKIVDVLTRIQQNLSIPIEFDNYKYYLTASIGIAIYPRDGKDVHTLLKNADIAMYKSKDLGKNNFHFFTESLDKLIQEKVAMQTLLLDALENNHFQLFYQPKVDIKTGKINSCEALIRLIDPKHGLIPPDKFIYLAEENNFILKLGEWVMREAAKQILAWRDTPFQNTKISINISAKQFNDKLLVDKLDIYTRDIDKSSLDIELTESVFVSDFDEKLEAITKIKELGFSLSLDDFGTGYSSLSYLKSIPFDTIKIDKSFIDGLENEKDKNFVVMIINIARTLNLEIVAEGVETQKQLKILQNMDCDIYQGYLCSKPVPIYEFEKLLKENV